MGEVATWVPIMIAVVSGLISGAVSSAVQHAVARTEITHIRQELARNEREHREIWRAVNASKNLL